MKFDKNYFKKSAFDTIIWFFKSIIEVFKEKSPATTITGIMLLICSIFILALVPIKMIYLLPLSIKKASKCDNKLDEMFIELSSKIEKFI